MTNVDHRDSERIAIRRLARSDDRLGFWLTRLALLVVVCALLVLLLGGPQSEREGTAVFGFVAGLALFAVVGLSLALAGLHRARLKRAEAASPDPFVMPLIITRELPDQVRQVAQALGGRSPALVAQRQAVLSADSDGIRLVSGNSANPDFVVSRFAVRSVATGTIQVSGGSAPCIEVVIGTPVGAYTLQFFVIRQARFIVKPQPLPVLERIASELRVTLRLQTT
ncbi:hypothetical protein [Agromyces sp. NPDC058110]|uniref:hypothetical protein n=1 Tax=Agromyces sp. NPDC058110 TaxID=3346345 RepID=UPI0036DAF12A